MVIEWLDLLQEVMPYLLFPLALTVLLDSFSLFGSHLDILRFYLCISDDGFSFLQLIVRHFD
jgi:hypothetical protein